MSLRTPRQRLAAILDVFAEKPSSSLLKQIISIALVGLGLPASAAPVAHVLAEAALPGEQWSTGELRQFSKFADDERTIEVASGRSRRTIQRRIRDLREHRTQNGRPLIRTQTYTGRGVVYQHDPEGWIDEALHAVSLPPDARKRAARWSMSPETRRQIEAIPNDPPFEDTPPPAAPLLTNTPRSDDPFSTPEFRTLAHDVVMRITGRPPRDNESRIVSAIWDARGRLPRAEFLAELDSILSATDAGCQGYEIKFIRGETPKRNVDGTEGVSVNKRHSVYFVCQPAWWAERLRHAQAHAEAAASGEPCSSCAAEQRTAAPARARKGRGGEVVYP